MFKTFLNVIYPPTCIGCGAFGLFICRKCLNKMVLREFTCVVCGEPCVEGYTHTSCLSIHAPERLVSIFNYEGVVRTSILASKFGGKTFSYLEYLDSLAVPQALKLIPKKPKNIVVIPIPLSKKRYSERGFNQAEIIAKDFSKSLGASCITNLLIKDVDTIDQATTTAKKDRKANVKSIFKISQKFLEKKGSTGFSPNGWDVILVDDVCTTGSTLLSASAVLKSFGFRYIWCFTIAKTPKLEEYYFNI